MDISALKGIGLSRAKLLRDMGIHTVSDIILCFPRDYEDRSQIKTICTLVPGGIYTIRGGVVAEAKNIDFCNNASPALTKLIVKDETGKLELAWFGRPYLKRNFKKQETYFFTGRVTESYGRLQMQSPDYEKITPAQAGSNLSAGRIVPIYSLPKGISQKMFRKWVKLALDKENMATKKSDALPKLIRENLCAYSEAIQNIHFPASNEQFYTARRRLVFEELFFVQLALLHIKGANLPGVQVKNIGLPKFLSRLPFVLTDAQQSVLADVSHDLQKGRCMNRLIQGDVGSGKTVVAAAAAYLVIKAGYQVAVMVPTEVLARQHFKQFSSYLPDFEVMLLIGSLTDKEKKSTNTAISKGTAKMVVGTHALIQEGVTFRNLALTITDEQHRFGVKQRAALYDKGIHPHTMIMTATPIPRTLSLILYGDMDISVIDGLPPGRLAIKTYCVDSSYRTRITAFMAKQVQEGRQVYVVCPAIEENEESDMDIHSVVTYAAQLQKALPEIPIARLHGRIKNKAEVLDAFVRKECPIIVSTTVIEVGVDVPNATLIVIENAERFGLSQLHQLRGRVGRGSYQSYCILVTDSKAEHTLKRMKAMRETPDGFALSELDLKLRGPGDFFGVRQHGLPNFTIANLYQDMDVLKEAQKAAAKIYDGLEITTEERRNMEHSLAMVLNGIAIL